MRYISVNQLSSVLYNWDKFSVFESLKSDRIVCVNCNGELLPIDSLTLLEGTHNNKRVFRLTIDAGSPCATLDSFLEGSESDKESLMLTRTQTKSFHSR